MAPRQTQRMKTSKMLRLVLLAISVSAAKARSWVMLVDPQVFVIDDIGRSRNALIEGDPLFTRSTFRPTSSPTITAKPTQFPTFPNPTRNPSISPTALPTIEASIIPTTSANPTASIVPTTSVEPTITAMPTTKRPTWAPGTAPTMSPTVRTEHQNGNGGCPAAEVLYEVVMYDRWGDGWDGRDLTIQRLGDDLTKETLDAELVARSHYVLTRTTLFSDGGSTVAIIKYNNSTSPAKTELVSENHTDGLPLSTNPIFKDTVIEGDVQIRFACLQPGRCYRATIEGGAWSEEISWEIRKAQLDNLVKSPREIVVNGAAPSNCRFSILGQGQDINDMFCANECHLPGEIPLLTFPPSVYTTEPPSRAPVESATFPTAKLADLTAPSISQRPSSAPVTQTPSSSPSTQTPTGGPSQAASDIPSSTPSFASSTPSLAPSAATLAPSESSETPSVATPSPSESSEVPSVATDPPSQSSEVPSVATDSPSQSSELPSVITASPSQSSANPTAVHSSNPTPEPSASPTNPTSSPSAATEEPTTSPTPEPSSAPSMAPIPVPTIEPTWSPTTSPTTPPETSEPSLAPVAPVAAPVAAPVNDSPAADNPASPVVDTPIDLPNGGFGSPVAPPINDSGFSPIAPVGRHNAPVSPRFGNIQQILVDRTPTPSPIAVVNTAAPVSDTAAPIASDNLPPIAPANWAPANWHGTPAWPSSPAHPAAPVATTVSPVAGDDVGSTTTDEDRPEFTFDFNFGGRGRHDNDDLLGH